MQLTPMSVDNRTEHIDQNLRVDATTPVRERRYFVTSRVKSAYILMMLYYELIVLPLINALKPDGVEFHPVTIDSLLTKGTGGWEEDQGKGCLGGERMRNLPRA